jgi:hypothetical protein
MNELNRIRIEALKTFLEPSSTEANLDRTLTGLKTIKGNGEPIENGDNWRETLRLYKETEKLAEEIAKSMGYQSARTHFIKAIELADKLSSQAQANQESLKQSLKVLSTGVLNDGTVLTETHEQILHAATVQTIRNCQYSSEIRIAWGKALLKGQKFFEAAEMFHSAEKFVNKIDSFYVKQEINLLEQCSRRPSTKASLAVAYRKASQRISLDKSQTGESSPLSAKAWTNFRGVSTQTGTFSRYN